MRTVVNPGHLREAASLLDVAGGELHVLARRLAGEALPEMPADVAARVRAGVGSASRTLSTRSRELAPEAGDLKRRATWAELLNRLELGLRPAPLGVFPLRVVLGLWRTVTPKHGKLKGAVRAGATGAGSARVGVFGAGSARVGVFKGSTRNLQGSTPNLQGSTPNLQGSDAHLQGPIRQPGVVPPPKEVPYFSQKNDSTLLNGVAGSTMAKYGCGVSSLAMVLSYFEVDIKPDEIARDSRFFAPGNDLLAWPAINTLTIGGKNFSENQPFRSSSGGKSAQVGPIIDRELGSANDPVIVYLKNAFPSGSPHYVVITGKNDGGGYVINDPIRGKGQTFSDFYSLDQVTQIVVVRPRH